MRLFRKLIVRLMLASVILALPQVALASGDALSDDGAGLEGIFENLSDEAVENLFLGMFLSGCFDRDPVTGINPWLGSAF